MEAIKPIPIQNLQPVLGHMLRAEHAGGPDGCKLLRSLDLSKLSMRSGPFRSGSSEQEILIEGGGISVDASGELIEMPRRTARRPVHEGKTFCYYVTSPLA